MTLEEAIKHAEKVVEENEKISLYTPVDFCGEAEIDRCAKVAAEYRQLVAWLKELDEWRKGIRVTFATAETETLYFGCCDEE